METGIIATMIKNQTDREWEMFWYMEIFQDFIYLEWGWGLCKHISPASFNVSTPFQTP